MADEEVVEEKIVIDYDAIDENTGFKKAEIDIWTGFEQGYLNKPEDDRGDVDAWVEEFSEEKKFDKKRVKFVVTVGIYAGPRDEFNQRTGSGKAIYPNGDVYDGEYYEGRKHGQGQYTFKKLGRSEVDKLVEKRVNQSQVDLNDAAQRQSFVSTTASALKVGRTIIDTVLEYGFFPCYHGDYVRGLRSGQGFMKNKDASVYKGEWKDNKRHGQGIFYYVNGDVYSGQWAEGLKHGFGVYRFADGGEYRGEWVKGVFTQGQWILADGTYFEGSFDKKNRPCDEHGVMHFPRQRISMAGVFQKNKWAPLHDLAVDDEVPLNEGAWGQ